MSIIEFQRHASRCLCAAALAAVGLFAATDSASAQTLGPLVQVSGDSPFGPVEDCGSNPGDPPGTNFVDSEAEPWLAVNPAAPDNVAVMWLQDPWSNGLSRGNVVGASFDAGETWSLVPVPKVSDCTDGPFDRAVDPWLSFGPDGTLYQISLALNIDPPANRSGGLGRNALLVSKSGDGGVTWNDPVSLIEDPNGYLNDKPSITADAAHSDYVYAAWQRFETAKGVLVAPPNPGLMFPFGLGFKSRTYFARSTDGGETWERARSIYNPGANNSTVGHQIAVLPDGTLAMFFLEFLSNRNDDGGSKFDVNLSLLRSTDKGVTWLPKGRPIRVAKINSFLDVVTPDEGLPVFGGIFDIAVDAQGGLHAVWQDRRFTGIEAIAYSMSSDGGFTWSTPIKVNQTPENASKPAREQAFLPSVAVNAQGVVAVTYYDFRNDDSSGELTDYFAALCDANTYDCSDPANWTSAELRLTDTSFDMKNTPYAMGTTVGYFVGDYEGLTSDGTDFLAAFAQPHGSDQDSIFFRRISP